MTSESDLITTTKKFDKQLQKLQPKVRMAAEAAIQDPEHPLNALKAMAKNSKTGENHYRIALAQEYRAVAIREGSS